MQNHGFAVDAASLPEGWKQNFYNANDQSNEGICHVKYPWFSVQFHPEAKGGPVDTDYLFDVFLNRVRGKMVNRTNIPMSAPFATTYSPTNVKKVLILGSGGLSIGQAGEFDYSGSQAIKALQEENIQTILINPNIATVQTQTGFADKVYYLPVTAEYVTRVLDIEKPSAILLQFGGQTALNVGVELYQSGALRDLNVEVLGTAVESIIDTEDREQFSARLQEINESIAPSFAAHTVEEALEAGQKLNYPVVVRAAFALGGLGSGFAHSEEELRDLATRALALSRQVLVEKSLMGWKEVEYEIVRDAYDNCVTVCNMENFDPLGVHTGESIVVAPSQTLTDAEYHMLREVSIKVARHLRIVGECNIQFALNPSSQQYFIIEVNARLSRSSALASKATGYPLAFVAAKLALGQPLPKLRNAVTQVTTACWEPSLDYVVVKVPRWDVNKFQRVDEVIGTSMKSVGEVMSIGRTFEEAIQKALRMVGAGGLHGFQSGFGGEVSDERLRVPSTVRVSVLAQALRDGYTVERVHELTRIDRWFLYRLQHISQLEARLRDLPGGLGGLTPSLLAEVKRAGFSDRQVAREVKSTESVVRDLRHEHGVLPFVKQIDTVAAEFPATNNYLYMTYCASEDDVSYEEGGAVIVLGSGAYCIGSSVEFDYCAVRCVQQLREMGHRTIMINYNPETVSTDYDESDRLYFEELSVERVADIFHKERGRGVIVSMGGQIPNNLVMSLARHQVTVLGTLPTMIENAENRFHFSRLLDLLGVDQPRWRNCVNLEETLSFCHEVGYPCLVRPSFVLSGAGMNVVHSDQELQQFLDSATTVSSDHVVVISKFIQNAKEIDMDAVAAQGELICYAVSEHVENAGVHSGDATLMLPARDINEATLQRVVEATRAIARELHISGPMNIQFIAKDDSIKVIECNVRASRSFPFVSKTLDADFIGLATRAILHDPTLQPLQPLQPVADRVGVKTPQFSFGRLRGSDPVTGVEMASTGEVAGFGRTHCEAYLKAMLASGFRLPRKTVLLSLGPYREKAEFLPYAAKLAAELGYELLATPGTADYLIEHKVPVRVVEWPQTELNEWSLESYLSNNAIDLAVILPSRNRSLRPSSILSRGYTARRMAVDYGVPLITNVKCAKLLVESMCKVPQPVPITQCDLRSSCRTVRLPGLIDVHVHLREPGGEHKEDWDTGTAAALAGGFTMVCAMPNVSPPAVDEATFSAVEQCARAKARCDYGLYMGASSTNAAQIPALAGRAVALKMYLNQTFTTLRLDDITVWMEHFRHWPTNRPLVVHAEGEKMAAALLVAALYPGRSVHVAHISLREEVVLIRRAKEQGLAVTCEVTPHHLFLSAEEAERRQLGQRARVCPRLATPDDVQALWDNLDVIDCIATDHAPHTVQEKDGSNPPPGFPGLETVLPLMLTAVSQGRLTLDELIEKMYTNPKRIFGLPDQPDTYVEVDLDARWTLPSAMAESRCQWNVFAGTEVRGRVQRVVLRGEVAYLDGKVYAKPGSGRNVSEVLPPASLGVGENNMPSTRLSGPTRVIGGQVISIGASTSSSSASASASSAAANDEQRVHASPSAEYLRTASAAASDERMTLRERLLRDRRPGTGASSSAALPAAAAVGPSTSLPAAATAASTPAPASQSVMVTARASRLFGSGLGAVHLPGSFDMKHVLSVKQFSRDNLRYLFAIAHEMRMMVKRVGTVDLLKGRVLASTFYEPSTRTSCSFEAAMLRLGGSVLHISAETSSATKGESLGDTIRTLESYVDCIVLRHPAVGSAKEAACAARRAPIINAGDGAGEHPTQALLDCFTIREELGSVNNLTITLLGDLKHGRTVHSLVQLLALYTIRRINYVSPESLRMPEHLVAKLDALSIEQGHYTSLDEVLPSTDVLYVTRIQRERFDDPAHYESVKNAFVITPSVLSKAKENMVILHPLPRVNEIDPAVDADPRAAYFRQVENGIFIRMALLATVLHAI